MKLVDFADVIQACLQAKAVIREFELVSGQKVTGYDLDPDTIAGSPVSPSYTLHETGAIRSVIRDEVIENARKGKYGSYASEWAEWAPTYCFIALPEGTLTAAQHWQVYNNLAYAQWRLGSSAYESWFSDFHKRASSYFAFVFGEHPWIPVDAMSRTLFLAYGQATSAQKGPKVEEMGLYAAFELWNNARSARKPLSLAFYDEFPFLQELNHLLRS